MFLFTGQGLLTILVIALFLFGPDKLPQIGRVVGRFMAEFKRAQEAVEATIRAEMYPEKAAIAEQAAPAFATSADEDDEEEDEE